MGLLMEIMEVGAVVILLALKFNISCHVTVHELAVMLLRQVPGFEVFH